MCGRIFIVDDDADAADLVRVVLTEAGHEVVGTAADGAEAVRRYRQLPRLPNLIIMDYQLPDRTGVSVAEELRSHHADVVILGCSGWWEAATAFQRLGRCLFLGKPYTAPELVAAVDLALAGVIV
jgi:two-component system chemotaxis response regulator CheY